MSEHGTSIQWTHWPGYRGETWNPTTGCTRVSPGCDHCYAFTLHDQRYVSNMEAAREHAVEVSKGTSRGVVDVMQTPATWRRRGYDGLPFPAQYDQPFSTIQMLDEHRLSQPLRWTKPRAIFVGSMADLFHEDVTDDFLDQVFAVMMLTPQHEYMLLTKRPERMREYMHTRGPKAQPHSIGYWMGKHDPSLPDRIPITWPPPNVGLMTTVEDQERADERIPILLDTPAAWRGLSIEPQLEAIELRPCRELPRIDWVICGGESGPHAREFNLAWARSLRAQCAAAGVAFFMKQLGSRPFEWTPLPGTSSVAAGRADAIVPQPDVEPYPASHHGGNPDEWPEDLRIREFPR